MTGSTHDRIRARGIALDRLTSLTMWIGLGAVAALCVLMGVAATTIPGHASPSTGAGDSASTDPAPTPSPVAGSRHHHDSSGSVSATTGQPIVVSGGSH